MTIAETTPNLEELEQQLRELQLAAERLQAPATPLGRELANLDAAIAAQAAELRGLQNGTAKMCQEFFAATNPRSKQRLAAAIGDRQRELEQSITGKRTEHQRLLDVESRAARFRLPGTALATGGAETAIAQAQAAAQLANQQRQAVWQERDQIIRRLGDRRRHLAMVVQQISSAGSSVELRALRRDVQEEIADLEASLKPAYQRVDDAQAAWVVAVEQPAKVQRALASEHRRGLRAQATLPAIDAKRDELHRQLNQLEVEASTAGAVVEQIRRAEIVGTGSLNGPELVKLAQIQEEVADQERRDLEKAGARAAGVRDQPRPATTPGVGWPNPAAAAAAVVGGFREVVRQATGRPVAR